MLLAAGAMVLLISVVNIANLLLARASSREREVAIHAALGSPRSRLVMRLLTESLVLALAGGALGIVLAGLAIRSIVALLPVNLPAWIDLRIDWRVLLFSAAVAIVTGVLFGLVPALRLTALDLHRSLKDGAKGS